MFMDEAKKVWEYPPSDRVSQSLSTSLSTSISISLPTNVVAVVSGFDSVK